MSSNKRLILSGLMVAGAALYFSHSNPAPTVQASNEAYIIQSKGRLEIDNDKTKAGPEIVFDSQDIRDLNEAINDLRNKLK